MKSRSLLVLMLMGIGALIAFGLVTKFAFDSNKSLRDVTTFKAALLESFAARGVEEVAYRPLPGRRGVVLRLVADPQRVRGESHLNDQIAEFFLEKFPRRVPFLKLVYLPPASFGCRSSTAFMEKEFRMAQVRQAMMERKNREALEREVAGRPGLTLLRTERRGRDLEVDLEAAADLDPGMDLSQALRDLAPAVVRFQRVATGGSVRLRILGTVEDPSAAATADGAARESQPTAQRTGVEPEVLAEGTFDHRGKERRR